ncbi:MAG: NUDIX hydrolase [Bacillota bacterium]
MERSWFGLNEIDSNENRYVVMITEYHNQLIIIRNKKHKLWELPGGKREQSEDLIQAASRELYEETGAIQFELTPFGVYLMNGSYGMMFFAKVTDLHKLPDYEIEEIMLVAKLPENLFYGPIYYDMYARWNNTDHQSLKTYIIDYKECKSKMCLYSSSFVH